MARLWHAGCETRLVGSTGSIYIFPDGGQSSGLPVADTSVFRSGLASWKYDSGANTSVNTEIDLPTTPVDGRSYFLRLYAKIPATPAAAVAIMTLQGSLGFQVRLRTDGALEILANNVVQGSPSAVITDNQWHRIEVKVVAVATGNWNACELVVDGTTVTSSSFTAFARGAFTVIFGWTAGGAGTNKLLWVDDLAVNDSTGSVNNSYPGDGKVVMLFPTADNAVGTGWTLGTGTAISANSGSTAVKNTPPLGVADLAAGSDPKQIRNATSNANSNYDATMTTYSAAGLASNDVVNAIIPWTITAAPVTTGAKQGTVGVVSNPAIANVALAAAGVAGAFWQGNAAGTFTTGWKPSQGTITERPTVTVGTAPVMRITQVTSSTRIAMVCFMAMYVEYTPAAVAARHRRQSNQVAVMRPALR